VSWLERLFHARIAIERYKFPQKELILPPTIALIIAPALILTFQIGSAEPRSLHLHRRLSPLRHIRQNHDTLLIQVMCLIPDSEALVLASREVRNAPRLGLATHELASGSGRIGIFLSYD
jgi:hypothetical protein